MATAMKFSLSAFLRNLPFTQALNTSSVVKMQNLTDREISWLAFNQRVLELAEDKSIPLLERVRFLTIFSSNLDEFYMVRVASVLRKIENNISTINSAGYAPQELLAEISRIAKDLVAHQYRIFEQDLRPALAQEGIELITWKDLKSEEKSHLQELFKSRIFPVLTPLAVDPSHPFPYISGLSLNLGVRVINPDTKEKFFARVKVPPILSRLIPTSENSTRFIPLEDLIAQNLDQLFPGMDIVGHLTFRVTRNQDLEIDEDDSEDLLTSLEQELLLRRFGPPVRLEVEEDVNQELLTMLMEELEIDPLNVIRCGHPVNLQDLSKIADLKIAALHFPSFNSKTPRALAGIDEEDHDVYFSALRQGEILLHHPYDSFTHSVVDFLNHAAADPKVLAIKQTLYRTSGDSPIVAALIEAAEAGKQVLAVIEIRARFDEQANVRWARKLEAAGVHVVYGLMGLKTHAKLSLVIRDEQSGIHRYAHVGTGNYNPKTARTYEDLGILSADEVLTEDLAKLFNQLSGFAPQSTYSRLLVAPKTLRSGLIEKIDREISHARAGEPAHIRLKLNSILDEEFCAKFYEASQAGVKIELLVRGICSVQAGVEGLSENIIARSVLGRFLEHSRVFYFLNDGDPEYWIGSADLMHRNLDRRVECLVRIFDPSHVRQLEEILNIGISDQTQSWRLTGQRWTRQAVAEDGTRLVDAHSHHLNKNLKGSQ
jgi:polyphosphate kinase